MAKGVWIGRQWAKWKAQSTEDRFYTTEMLWKAAIILGALFAGYEYFEAREAKRVERSMTYIDTFERGDVASARAVVNAALRPYASDFAAMARQGGVSAADKKAIIQTLVDDDPEGKLADSIDRQVDFYEGLRLCVSEDLCSKGVVTGYFCPARASVLWNDFKPYIDERRANNSEYARGLQWCATMKS